MLSQTELLNKTYSAENNYLFGGLLRPGLYVLAGTSKVGKSIMATTIANDVAKGEDFLGQVMPQGKVLYFDNDNYDYEAKGRIIALNLLENDDIFMNLISLNLLMILNMFFIALKILRIIDWLLLIHILD
ncbi:MAG: AAA family ATPase [Erysipelotrichaceae bacterium]|nr:AAA family ATPase [Erysipelotrichaceae bacterium]